jgi:hypothetical protein
MSEAEERLLAALAWMASQYLETPDGSFDHMAMSAGEAAVARLVEYGLIEPDGRGGTWTPAGRDFLASH